MIMKLRELSGKSVLWFLTLTSKTQYSWEEKQEISQLTSQWHSGSRKGEKSRSYRQKILKVRLLKGSKEKLKISLCTFIPLDSRTYSPSLLFVILLAGELDMKFVVELGAYDSPKIMITSQSKNSFWIFVGTPHVWKWCMYIY